MLELGLTAVFSFAIGWLVRGYGRRRDLRARQQRWQRKVDQLEGSLAVERLRVERFIFENQIDGDPDVAPTIELHREPKSARPRVRNSESTAAEA